MPDQHAARFESRLRAVCYLSAVRFARSLSTFAASLAVAGLAASFPACSNSGDNGSGDSGDDGMSAISLDSTLPPGDVSACDPCQSVCACQPGDMFYNQARCGYEVCGQNGLWGGVSCTVGPGCPACDPCKQMCPCTYTDTVFNDAACIVEVCPQSGMWGEWNCTGPGCLPEAGVDGGDASLDGGSDVAANEAGADVMPDAVGAD